MPRPLLLLLPVAGALALSACGNGPVSATEVATTAEDLLEEETGVRPEISCPRGVEREDGASTRCTLTGGEDDVEYGVRVTVTEVDGDLRLAVVRSLSAEEVATAAEDALEEEVGTRPDISCPDELVGEDGASTRCVLTAEGDDAEYGVDVTVVRSGGDLRIDVEVDEEPTE